MQLEHNIINEIAFEIKSIYYNKKDKNIQFTFVESGKRKWHKIQIHIFFLTHTIDKLSPSNLVKYK
jgi:hypothetical protein